MKIFCFLHMYPPIHMAGSETTVHAAMRAMVQRGHSVTVLADRTPEAYEYDGVKVLNIPQQGHQHYRIQELAKDADILITHLDCTVPAMQLALDLEKPLVHFVHNHRQLNWHSVNPFKCQLAIFNSQWIAARQKFHDPLSRKEVPWPGKSIVMHPIVEPEKYKCERGDKITLCNPTDGKGICTLHKVSEVLKHREFLVVEGIYGEQIAPPNLGEEWEAAHPNIEHMKNTPDVREVFRKTRIVLMPSLYESYGRVAVEAACAGIPSIVHPTEGLLEALGAEMPEWIVEFTRAKLENEGTPTPEQLRGGWVSGAGIFCDRDDIPSWQAQIERLYSDEIYYRSRSDAALKLADSFDPEGEFDRLEDALLVTSQNWLSRNEVAMVKMWTPDVRLWETTEGKLVREIAGRIPQNALRQWGLEPIPEEVAIANGLIPAPEAKAIEAPAENKAIAAPAEKKTRKKKEAA